MTRRWKKTEARWLRPGHWVPPGLEEVPVGQEPIAAWFAAAPYSLGVLFGILLPHDREERVRKLLHAGHVWRNIIRTEPALIDWSERTLLDWLDAMPGSDAPVLPVLDGDAISLEEMYDSMWDHLQELPTKLGAMVEGWHTTEMQIGMAEAVLVPDTRALLLRSGERARFRALLREDAETRDWWAAHGQDWLDRRPPLPKQRRRVAARTTE